MLLSERPIHSSADTPGTSLVFPLPCETDLYRVSSLGTTPDGSDVWCWGHAAADMPAAVAVVAAAAATSDTHDVNAEEGSPGAKSAPWVSSVSRLSAIVIGRTSSPPSPATPSLLASSRPRGALVAACCASMTTGQSAERPRRLARELLMSLSAWCRPRQMERPFVGRLVCETRDDPN